MRPSWPWRRHSICASARCPIFHIPCESGRFQARGRRASSDLEEGSMRYPTTHTCRERKDGAAASSASPGILSPAPRQPDLGEPKHRATLLSPKRKVATHRICLNTRFARTFVKPPARPNRPNPMIWETLQDISQSNLVPGTSVFLHLKSPSKSIRSLAVMIVQLKIVN